MSSRILLEMSGGFPELATKHFFINRGAGSIAKLRHLTLPFM